MVSKLPRVSRFGIFTGGLGIDFFARIPSNYGYISIVQYCTRKLLYVKVLVTTL